MLQQSRSESVLDIVDGKAQRIVRVLSMYIKNGQGQVLFEDEQVLPDGRSRRRNITVSLRCTREQHAVKHCAQPCAEDVCKRYCLACRNHFI